MATRRGYLDTPYHTTVPKAKDERRHKSRCIHLVKKLNKCHKKLERCTGSAHCAYYEEGESQNIHQESPHLSRIQVTERTRNFGGAKSSASNISKKEGYKVLGLKKGSVIEHVKFGIGTVLNLEKM